MASRRARESRMRRGSARSWTRCVRGAATRHDVTTGGPPPSTSVSPFPRQRPAADREARYFAIAARRVSPR
ncbi:hypothetical protein PLES_19471 [Pseudomonas aeruginosa LESB58]|nr:hypothetical protein PLES_19471 [Pseudomonas aeruginosa LESB58]